MRLFRTDLNINFVGAMNLLLVMSGALLLVSVVLMVAKGLDYGIDFKGGIEIQIKLASPVGIGRIRDALEEGGAGNVAVQAFGEIRSNEYLLRLEGAGEDIKETAGRLSRALSDHLGVEFEIRRTDMVGPRVGSELRRNGIWAVVFSLIFILIYIAFRFDTKFAPGAVIALIHDVIITVGVFVLLDKEFNLAIIAALLTIVGYSLNDTIVVFDRIRENIKLIGGSSLRKVVNISLNQTLSRTILTSVTTLFVVVSLFLFGGPILRDFSFAMCFGIIVGTYSSIFIASPVVLILDRYMKK